MSDTPGNPFSDAAAYEIYVGRWSRLVAQQFLGWLDLPTGGTWLDVGAGTGILTQMILDHCAPAQVVGVDTSEYYLDFARQAVTDPRADFRTGNASEMNFGGSAFDAAVAGLVLNFVPSPDAAVASMRDAVRSGGMVAAYVWDYGDRMLMMRHFWDAASDIDPAAREHDSGIRFTICDPENLRSLFETQGLMHVETTAIDILTVFSDFDDFWLPFLAAQGSVSKYLRSLDDEGRGAIRQQLLHDLPIRDDSSIHLSARAWAVKGTR
jgi:SAM-dependent methyltransferase